MARDPTSPSRDELQTRIESLQAEVTKFIVVKQELIDTNGLLDRERSRFSGIQVCSEELLRAQDLGSFATLLLESILETFEFEVSLFMRFDSARNCLDIVGQVGLDETPESLPFHLDWLKSKAGVILPPGHQLLEAWTSVALGEAIVCPFFDETGNSLAGLVAAGTTTAGLDYFDPINVEVVSSFSVMVGQAGSLLANFDLKSKLQEQNIQLDHYSKDLEGLVEERTKELRLANKDLDVANRFIRKTFGRYLSDDIVDTILESEYDGGVAGEKRRVSLLMSDLRGFTAISERLPAEDVLQILNIYLGAMTEIIMRYNGTIDEFIGDSIFALFGAPIQRPDDHLRSVACALEMQLGMEQVNRECRELGYPDVHQGIGINTGEVVVGNIGSDKRAKYGVVGRNVNITARIESRTLGEQILISRSTKEACGDVLDIVGQQEISAKGLAHPLAIFEVRGIRGEYNLVLPEELEDQRMEFEHPLRATFAVLVSKSVRGQVHEGYLTSLGKRAAELKTEHPLRTPANLQISLFDRGGELVTNDLFAKVLEPGSGEAPSYLLRFTFVPPEAQGFITSCIETVGG